MLRLMISFLIILFYFVNALPTEGIKIWI